jgi:integrase
VRVPDALRKVVGKGEIVKSLGAGDLKEAQQQARLERVKLDGEWEALRRRLSPAKIDRLSEAEIWYLVSGWLVAAEKSAVDKRESWASLTDASMDLSDLSEDHNLWSAAHAETDKLLASEGINLAPSSDSRRLLEARMGDAILEATKRSFRRQFPTVPLHLDQQFADLTAATKVKPVANFTLATLMKDIGDDPARPSVRGKTVVKREAQWRVIKEFFGPDAALEDISRPRIKEFMRLLERLPSNATKHFPDATIFEAVALGEQKKLPPMSADTANGYLRQLGSLFRYAVAEGMYAADPTVGLLFPKPKIRDKDKRLPFDTGDLRAIFAAPLYTGSVDDQSGYNRPGPNIVRRGRFWVPLIALFTGMRLNEICQLTLDDFVHTDGVDIILIRGDDDDETKRVKTEAGHRFVPVHPELCRIGLMAYLDNRRANDKPTAALFPELPLGSTGYRSDPFSKYFARFLDHVGVSNPKKVFHSFRHNYRDALREADLSIERVRALGGWATGRTEDDYGSGLKPSTLAKDIKAIRYPALDLSHL